MASQAVSLMLGAEQASVIFFNFSVNFETGGGKWKHAILKVNIDEATLQLVYKEKVRYEVSLAEVAAAGGAPMYRLAEGDAYRLALAVGPEAFPSLETYNPVDRTILQELLDAFAAEGSLTHLSEAYPRHVLHHGVLEKRGKYAWAQRHCIVVKWKMYVFRSWHTTQALQSICLIGLQGKISRRGKQEIVIDTAHKAFSFRAMDAAHRDVWYSALMIASSLELEPVAALRDSVGRASASLRLSTASPRDSDDGTTGGIEEQLQKAQAAALRIMRGGVGSSRAYDLDATLDATQTPDAKQASALRVHHGNGRRAYDLDALDDPRDGEQVSLSVWLPHSEAEIAGGLPGFLEVTATWLGVAVDDIEVQSLETQDAGTSVSLQALFRGHRGDEMTPAELLASILESEVFSQALAAIYPVFPLLDFDASGGDGQSIELVLDTTEAGFSATEPEFGAAVTAAAGIPVALSARVGPPEFGESTAVQVTAVAPAQAIEKAASDGRLAKAVRQAAMSMGHDVDWTPSVDILSHDRASFCLGAQDNVELADCIAPAISACTGMAAEVTEVLAGKGMGGIAMCRFGPSTAPGSKRIKFASDASRAEQASAALNCASYSARLAAALHVYESRCRADSLNGGGRPRAGTHATLESLVERIRANDPTLTAVSGLKLLSAHELNDICAAMMENTFVEELDLRGQPACSDLSVAEALKGLLIANGSLTELNLAGTGLGPTGMAVLASGLALNEALRDISLAGNGCGDAGVEALAGALSGHSSVTDVNLSDNNITSLGAVAIASILRTTDTRIVLTGNRIDDSGASALAAALKDNREVTPAVRLAFNEIGENGACDLFEALLGRSVNALDLAHNCIGENGAWALGEMLKQPDSDVAAINISGNALGDLGCGYVMDALQTNPKSVSFISVAANGITPVGAAAISSVLEHNGTLEHVDLSNNALGDSGAAALAVGLASNGGLTRLTAAANNFGPDGMARIASALAENATVRRLDVSGNDLGDDGVAQLSQHVAPNRALREIELNDCAVTAAAAPALTQLLANQGIQNIDLGNNIEFGDVGVAALANGVPASTEILYVNLHQSGVSADGKRPLERKPNVVVLEAQTREPRAASSQVKKYRALYAYEPDPASTGCIGFAAGDIIVGVESGRESGEWLHGYVDQKGADAPAAGYFPSTFVKLLPTSDPAMLRKAYGGSTTSQWATSGRQHRDADDQAFMRNYLSDQRRRARQEQLVQLEQRHERRRAMAQAVNTNAPAVPDTQLSGADRMAAVARMETSRARKTSGRARVASGGGMLALLAYWRTVESAEEGDASAPAAASDSAALLGEECQRKVAAVQQLQNEARTQERLDQELSRVEAELVSTRLSLSTT